jgi:hypothetical protein
MDRSVNSIVAIFENFAIAPDCLLMDHRIGRGHVAWRGDTLPVDLIQVMDRIRGA